MTVILLLCTDNRSQTEFSRTTIEIVNPSDDFMNYIADYDTIRLVYKEKQQSGYIVSWDGIIDIDNYLYTIFEGSENVHLFYDKQTGKGLVIDSNKLSKNKNKSPGGYTMNKSGLQVNDICQERSEEEFALRKTSSGTVKRFVWHWCVWLDKYNIYETN
jgi:hypothetical protein